MDAPEAERPPRPILPTWLASERPIARTVGRPIRQFLHIEASGGIVLLAATVAALVWANLPGDSYTEFWHSEISLDVAGYELHEELLHWVNDLLMAVFFFLVGLEIKREWEVGELVDRRAALLPAVGALGGMVVPALVFVAFNAGSDQVDGWGIPMATDIAFALGIVALVGDRVPGALKVFLLTLAIVDDIGAILVIAVFYTDDLSMGWLGLAALLIAFTYALKRARVWYLPVYVVLAAGVWLTAFESGVHATIAGVALGVITPTHSLNRELSRAQVEAVINDPELDEVSRTTEAARLINESVPIGSRLIRAIHPWTSFVIIPVFALANAGIELSGGALSDAAGSSVTLGVATGLVVGKIAGIAGAVFLVVRLGAARLPAGSTAAQLVGMCAVAGVGFTVSLFISGLAYDDGAVLSEAKIGILGASAVAAVLGSVILLRAGGIEADDPEPGSGNDSEDREGVAEPADAGI